MERHKAREKERDRNKLTKKQNIQTNKQRGGGAGGKTRTETG